MHTSDPHPLLAHLAAARTASAPGRLLRGVVLPFRAVAFLARRPGLWPLVLVPALINLVLFVLAAGVVVTQVDAALGWLWPRPATEAWFAWGLLALWYAFGAVLVVAGFVLAYVLVLLVGGIVASPFSDALSAQTERALTGQPAPQPAGSFLGGVLHSIGSTALITGLYLLLLLPVLLLNVVPVLGSIAAAVGGACLGAFFVALEYADTTFERYGLRLGQKVRTLRAHLALALGVGLGVSFLLWIPLLNFLCIPIAVVCGTALALTLRTTDAH